MLEVVAVPVDKKSDGKVVRRDTFSSLPEATRQKVIRAIEGVTDGSTQAREIGVWRPSTLSGSRPAAEASYVRPGFSGGTPYEIAQLFDEGKLSREQAIEELGRWDYRPGSVSDGYDWSTADAGEFTSVERAHTDHLIDDAMYEAILIRYSEQGR